MGQSQLVELCLENEKCLHRLEQRVDSLLLEVESSARYANLMRNSKEEVHRMNHKLTLSSEQLQQAMNEQLKKHARLHGEHEGLRTAVDRQTREILALRCELDTLKSDTLSTPLVENIQLMIEEMGELLMDPVSFELLHDPVTLVTGHTFNRGTVVNMSERSEVKCKCLKKCGVFLCPMTRKCVPGVPEQNTFIVAKLPELYLRMSAWLVEVHKSECE